MNNSEETPTDFPSNPNPYSQVTRDGKLWMYFPNLGWVRMQKKKS